MITMLRYSIKDFTQFDLIKVSSRVVYQPCPRHHTNEPKWATFLALITASVVDIFIAASLCFTLARLKTGGERYVFFNGRDLER